MGRKTSGIYSANDGSWQVDKWYEGNRLRQRGFQSHEEAEGWLIKQLEALRAIVLHGERPPRTFEQAATRYLLANVDKPRRGTCSRTWTSRPSRPRRTCFSR